MRVLPMLMLAGLLWNVLLCGCHSRMFKPVTKPTEDVSSKTEAEANASNDNTGASSQDLESENSTDIEETTVLKFQKPDEIRARMIDRIFPEYPKAARKAGIQGEVITRLYFDEKGDLDQYKIITGQPVFIGAVKKALLRIKLKPHLVNGRPVKTFTVYKFVFKLN